MPKGVSREDFGRAIFEFRALLGDDSVIVNPEGMTSYSKIMLAVDDEAHHASGALVPASVDEVQRIMGICNKYRVPVWPVSTGKNLGCGSVAPATPGQMVLDLAVVHLYSVFKNQKGGATAPNTHKDINPVLPALGAQILNREQAGGV